MRLEKLDLEGDTFNTAGGDFLWHFIACHESPKWTTTEFYITLSERVQEDMYTHST